jgi:hypothetical protein
MAAPRGAAHTAGPNHMEVCMKFPLPVAAALTGAAQAQIETGASRHGLMFAADLVIAADPPLTAFTPPSLAPQRWPCFRSAPVAPPCQLRGGDAVGSLN